MTTALIETSGFVDAHSHLRSTSLVDQGIAGSSRLEEAILRMTAMSAVDPFDDAFVASADLVLAGVTGVQVIFHTFADRSGYLESLLATAKGIEKSGIRALVVLGITDRAEFLPEKLGDASLLPEWLPPKHNISVKDLLWIYEQAKEAFPNIEFGLAPVGAQWCSDETLAQLGEAVRGGVRTHTHLLESDWQRNWIAENPIDRLSRFGLLGPKSSMAHAIWCTTDDLKKISDAGAQLVTCPGSNQLLRSGSAPLDEWRRAGVKFGFGLDSAADSIRPFEIATQVMDRETALIALTSGGQACTDLDVASDVVSWSDFEKGECKAVTIRGQQLVAAGIPIYEAELAESRLRIAEAMRNDFDDRARRQARITNLMPRYLSELSRCCG